jgi:hypothetical protein
MGHGGRNEEAQVMNSKIKQLAEQVGAVRNVLAMGRHDGVLFTEFELEKFAELIVKECADIASINQHQYDSVGKYVLEHFGVK